jgi:hypothetical protein
MNDPIKQDIFYQCCGSRSRSRYVKSEYFGYRGLKREKEIEIKRVEITGEFRLKRFKYIYRVVQKKVYEMI